MPLLATWGPMLRASRQPYQQVLPSTLWVGIDPGGQVRDVDDMKDLKRAYMELVRVHGKEVTGYKAFRQSLLDLNRRHRLEAIKMYVDIISRVERRLGRKTVGSRGRPTTG